MRVLLKFTFPNESGNKLIRDGSLPKLMESILGELKPEAAYFTTMDGLRGGYIFLDMKDPADMVRIAEPLFLGFNATVDVQPVMTPEDIKKAAQHMQAAAQRYG